jgi:hypothetical protein
LRNNTDNNKIIKARQTNKPNKTKQNSRIHTRGKYEETRKCAEKRSIGSLSARHQEERNKRRRRGKKKKKEKERNKMHT